eukprot:TRINITY_DN468_c4_g1_i2.p1 TRINITY_DN468_c4_g1~~TRINITY_DN468_c4_g1_i2.p1  ORF type:complete len:457 (+),score=43.66 TRINITY_DN468_c4_g1_i2:68-1372(+)
MSLNGSNRDSNDMPVQHHGTPNPSQYEIDISCLLPSENTGIVKWSSNHKRKHDVWLPSDVVRQIFYFLTHREAVRLMGVCTAFRSSMRSDDKTAAVFWNNGLHTVCRGLCLPYTPRPYLKAADMHEIYVLLFKWKHLSVAAAPPDIITLPTFVLKLVIAFPVVVYLQISLLGICCVLGQQNGPFLPAWTGLMSGYMVAVFAGCLSVLKRIMRSRAMGGTQLVEHFNIIPRRCLVHSNLIVVVASLLGIVAGVVLLNLISIRVLPERFWSLAMAVFTGSHLIVSLMCLVEIARSITHRSVLAMEAVNLQMLVSFKGFASPVHCILPLCFNANLTVFFALAWGCPGQVALLSLPLHFALISLWTTPNPLRKKFRKLFLRPVTCVTCTAMNLTLLLLSLSVEYRSIHYAVVFTPVWCTPFLVLICFVGVLCHSLQAG